MLPMPDLRTHRCRCLARITVQSHYEPRAKPVHFRRDTCPGEPTSPTTSAYRQDIYRSTHANQESYKQQDTQETCRRPRSSPLVPEVRPDSAVTCNLRPDRRTGQADPD